MVPSTVKVLLSVVSQDMAEMVIVHPNFHLQKAGDEKG